MKKIKSLLYDYCVEYVSMRIAHVQTAIDAASESGNDETKSSAGDKHETGRAMMQLEQEKNSKQSFEVLELKKMLEKINPLQDSKTVIFGSLVITDKGSFYISIGVGKIIIDNIIYYAISPLSPLGMVLIGGKQGNKINFNSQIYTIKEVE
jgi:hypothetical protein